MGLFEGKSTSERYKIIIAMVLAPLAIGSLIYTFGGAFFSGSKPASSASATPTPVAVGTTPLAEETRRVESLPERSEIERVYSSVPINFIGSTAYSVPITGRNIFAFWEPGDPTPVPTRTPTPFQPPTPTPTPNYKIFLSFVTPQSVYAGSKRFTLEVNGEKFDPESRIIFNGAPLETNFISEQRLTAVVPASLISRSYTGSVMVDNPGTDRFSRQASFSVQEPPKPEFEYIGMIARQHYNNDTAYFQDKGISDKDPFSARLNDVLKGRFRVISISEKAVEFEDTRLGFKHKLPLRKPEEGRGGDSGSGYGESPAGLSPNPAGIPANIRRVNPRRNRRTPPTRRNITVPTPNRGTKQDNDNR